MGATRSMSPLQAITEPQWLADSLLSSSPIMLTFPPPSQGQLHSSTASNNTTILNVLEISCHLGYCVSASPCQIPPPHPRPGGRAHFSLSSRTIQTLKSAADLSWVGECSLSPVAGLGLQGQEASDQPSFSLTHTQPPGSLLLLNVSSNRPQEPHSTEPDCSATQLLAANKTWLRPLRGPEH